MKYCVTYDRRFRYLNEVDEVRLEDIKHPDNLIENLNMLWEPDQTPRIIIARTSDLQAAIPAIAYARTQGYDIAVEIDNTSYLDDVREAGIPFILSKFARTVEDVVAQAKQGASDIYIVESLGFSIRDIQPIRQSYNVKFRVFPNIAQSANNKEIDGVERFWIRPEDTELYEPYVDVFEILGGDDSSRLSVVYEIYRDRQWLGNLNDIILDLKEPIINNRGMSPHFGEMRLNCGKKCLVNRCNLCQQIQTLSSAFVDVGIEVVKSKYRPERTIEELETQINKLKEMRNELKTNEDTDNPESTTAEYTTIQTTEG